MLVDKYRIVKNADREIRELILRLKNSWLKMEAQIVFLRRIWNTLPDQYQIHLHTILIQLQFKLQQATVLIDGLIGKQTRKRQSRMS